MSHYLEAFFPILEISKWRISLNVPRVVPRLCPDNKRNSSRPHSSPLNSDSVHFVIAKNQMSIGKVLIFLSFLFRLTFRASETCLFTNFMAFCMFQLGNKNRLLTFHPQSYISILCKGRKNNFNNFRLGSSACLARVLSVSVLK